MADGGGCGLDGDDLDERRDLEIPRVARVQRETGGARGRGDQATKVSPRSSPLMELAGRILLAMYRRGLVAVVAALAVVALVFAVMALNRASTLTKAVAQTPVSFPPAASATSVPVPGADDESSCGECGRQQRTGDRRPIEQCAGSAGRRLPGRRLHGRRRRNIAGHPLDLAGRRKLRLGREELRRRRYRLFDRRDGEGRALFGTCRGACGDGTDDRDRQWRALRHPEHQRSDRDQSRRNSHLQSLACGAASRRSSSPRVRCGR